VSVGSLPVGMQFLRIGEHFLVSNHSELCVWSVSALMLGVSVKKNINMSQQLNNIITK